MMNAIRQGEFSIIFFPFDAERQKGEEEREDEEQTDLGFLIFSYFSE
jgi:hypothetical protein